MPIPRTCKQCGASFLVKPFHVRNGYGIFCSRACSYESMRNGKRTSCATCGKEIYKTAMEVGRSKSGKYFCDKSCQTIWRNKEFSGEKHKLWARGGSTYRDILIRKNTPRICAACAIADTRVLAAHHIDTNHQNNDPKNLQWLCHNCHHCVHNVWDQQI